MFRVGGSVTVMVWDGVRVTDKKQSILLCKLLGTVSMSNNIINR